MYSPKGSGARRKRETSWRTFWARTDRLCPGCMKTRTRQWLRLTALSQEKSGTTVIILCVWKRLRRLALRNYDRLPSSVDCDTVQMK
jgi:hypothetical protein